MARRVRSHRAATAAPQPASQAHQGRVRGVAAALGPHHFQGLENGGRGVGGDPHAVLTHFWGGKGRRQSHRETAGHPAPRPEPRTRPPQPASHSHTASPRAAERPLVYPTWPEGVQSTSPLLLTPCRPRPQHGFPRAPPRWRLRTPPPPPSTLCQPPSRALPCACVTNIPNSKPPHPKPWLPPKSHVCTRTPAREGALPGPQDLTKARQVPLGPHYTLHGQRRCSKPSG